MYKFQEESTFMETLIISGKEVSAKIRGELSAKIEKAVAETLCKQYPDRAFSARRHTDQNNIFHALSERL